MMRDEGEKQAPPLRVLLFDYTELSPDFRANPHKVLDPQREERPVERDALLSALLLTSYGLGREMLLDQKLSRDFADAADNNLIIANVRKLNAAVEAEFGPHASILTLDNKEHARVRTIVAEAFLKRAALAQALIERSVNGALDKLAGRERFDVVEEYAARIPISVLGAILGCDPADFAQLRAWTEAGQQAFDPTPNSDREERAIAGRRGILGYFRDLMAERAAAPRDDLISDLIAARDGGAPIADHEILHNLFALLVAGHLTTSDLIGNGAYLLLERPDVRDEILKNPELIAGAVEEVLRFEPPISFTARFAKGDGAIGGCPYHKGDGLTVNLLAANRDPEKFDDPHHFDIHRKRNPHMAFGAGAHICIGAPLARIEGQTAILNLLQRFPKLRRAEPGAPEWRATMGVRGLAKLEVLTT